MQAHHEVKLTEGVPNKNTGNGFLNTWIDSDRRGSAEADAVLLSHRRTVQGIRDSERITELLLKKDVERYFPPKQQRFGRYYPQLCFGLHYGAAVEGAIGTDLKVDASYLGSEVQMVEAIMALTKVYDVPIILTGPVFDRLSDEWKQTCRKIDRVHAKGYGIEDAFWIYTPNIASVDGNYFDPSIKEDLAELDDWDDDQLAERQVAKAKLKAGIISKVSSARLNDYTVESKTKTIVPLRCRTTSRIAETNDGRYCLTSSTKASRLLCAPRQTHALDVALALY
jgi:hypothetical protein